VSTASKSDPTGDRRRIAVLGAGANGVSIGADLVRAGFDVTLIEQWPDNVDALRRDGATVVMPEGTQVTPVEVMHLCDVATLRAPFDVVLLLVKAYDTAWAARLIEPWLAPDGLLVGVQNGMTAHTIAEVVGAHRTLGCVIEISSAMWEPGVVERHSGPSRSWFAVGSFDASTRGREQEVAGLLAHAGTAEVVDEIIAAKWMKLVSNSCTLALTAIVDRSIVDTIALPGLRELMLAAGNETLALAQASGARIQPIFGLTADDVARPDTVVDVLLTALAAGFVLPNTTTTVLQDWRKGRRSEVGDVNGLVARESERLGLPAPANRAVVEVATAIEAGRLTAGPHTVELLQSLAFDRQKEYS
jgi:2-dehydropantoate 2-reductase